MLFKFTNREKRNKQNIKPELKKLCILIERLINFCNGLLSREPYYKDYIKISLLDSIERLDILDEISTMLSNKKLKFYYNELLNNILESVYDKYIIDDWITCYIDIHKLRDHVDKLKTTLKYLEKEINDKD